MPISLTMFLATHVLDFPFARGCGPQKPRAVDEMPRVRSKWPELFLSCVQQLKVAVRS